MKENKVIRRTQGFISLIILCLMLIIGSLPALAAATLNISIPYSQTFKTEYRDVDNAFCYDLIPLDGAPIQAENNEVWISGYGMTSGNIPMSFDKPGNYIYTLSASDKYKRTGYTYEDEIYTISITIKESSGSLQLVSLIIQGINKYKYPVLELDPTYVRPEEPGSSPTVTPTKEPEVSPSAIPSESLIPSPSAAPSTSPNESSNSNNGSSGTSGSGGNGGSSGSGKGQSNTTGSPKTGDETPLAALIVMALFSVFMVVFLVWWDRREEKRKGGKT